MDGLWHFFVHWTGGDYPAPYGVPYGHLMPYDWLSGILGLSFIGLFLTVFRRHNCHVRWCLRLGRHDVTDPVTGVTYKVCRRHHPCAPDKGLKRGDAAAMACAPPEGTAT